MKSETTTEILNSIQNHINLEVDSAAQNKAVGRGYLEINGKNVQVWVTNQKSQNTNVTYFDKYGVQQVVRTNCHTYTHDGAVTQKNSDYGRKILHSTKGTFTTNVNGREISFTVLDSASYTPLNKDAKDLRVGLGEKGWVSFQSLIEALKAYSQNIDSLQVNEQQKKNAAEKKAALEAENKRIAEEKAKELQRIKDEQEKKRLEEQHRIEEEERLRRIKEEEERVRQLEKEADELEEALLANQEKYAQAASFIRKQASLRMKPNLDEVQDEIKFSNMFDGTTSIINGGPGTGKTTTLIQRLKLLICRDDLEDYRNNHNDCSLTDKQLDVVTANGGNWIFFSPTELLKQYLKENMNYEGLSDTSNKVQVWSSYLKRILRDNYKLVSDSGPFTLKKSLIGTTLILNNEMKVVDEFVAFYLNDIKSELQKLTTIETSQYEWNYIGEAIKECCIEAQKANSIREICLLLMRLSRIRDKFFGDSLSAKKMPRASEMIESYNSQITKIAAVYQAQWKKDKELYDNLLNLVDMDNSDIDDETEDNESDLIDAGLENKLAQETRKLLKKLALSLVTETEIKGKSRELYDIVGAKIQNEELQTLGQVAFFNKVMYPYIRNYEQLLFSRIPKTYKTYRKSCLDNIDNTTWDVARLEAIVTKSRNMILHPQEQSLLVGFINNLVMEIKSISDDRFDNLSHKYAVAYKDVCRPVIGIDEATDYCVMDYYAISSLKHWEVSSFTLTGDGMQCLIENGIFDWKQLKDKRLFPKIDIHNLKISYRQSKELVKLAHSLYLRTMKKRAPYKCYLDKVDNVPHPLWFENDDEEEKAEWIVNRVIEIKNNYGFVPSIAIFVADEKDAKSLKDSIDDIGRLESSGIDVVDCSDGEKLSASDTVRIFPLNKVKGMEFEVVFFHNVDKVQLMVERFLYVGLSRATFYMGVTSNELEEDDLLLDTKKLFKSRGNWRKVAE